MLGFTIADVQPADLQASAARDRRHTDDGVVSSERCNNPVFVGSRSTHRIPKGPGRRLKSLARQRFMELFGQGVPLRAAAIEVGVSRSTAQIWKNGTTVRRKDGTVKVVPPLEHLAVRPISPQFLSEEERVRIADMASRRDGPTVIGQALGRVASTISRELRRNLHTTGRYRPFHAQVLAVQRRRRPKQPKIASNAELRGLVVDRFAEKWSPQQISRALRAAHPDEPAMLLATESIYLALSCLANGLVSKLSPHQIRASSTHPATSFLLTSRSRWMPGSVASWNTLARLTASRGGAERPQRVARRSILCEAREGVTRPPQWALHACSPFHDLPLIHTSTSQ